MCRSLVNLTEDQSLKSYIPYLLILFFFFLSEASKAEINLRGYASMGVSSLVDSNGGGDGQEDPKNVGIVGKRADFYRDLRFGLNITSFLDQDERLLFSSQLGAEQVNIFYGSAYRNIPGDPNLRITMAKLKYEAHESLNVDMGLLPANLWLISQETLISYTYPWMRPPLDVYFSADVISMAGAGISYSRELGDFTVSAKLQFGDPVYKDTPWDSQTTVSSAGTYGRFSEITVEYDNMLGRIAYAESLESTLYFDNMQPQTSTDENGLETVYERESVSEVKFKKVTFFALGFRGDIGDFSILSEYTRRASEQGDGMGIRGNAISNAKITMEGAYTTIGYNIRDFMPHITFAGSRQTIKKDRLSLGSTETTLPPELEEIASYQAMVAAAKGTNLGQETVILGLNYFYTPLFTVKLALEHINADKDYGGITLSQAGSQGTLVSLGASFIY